MLDLIILLVSTAITVAAVIFKKSLIEALRYCCDCITECFRSSDNWERELGTYSSSSDFSIPSGLAEPLSAGDILRALENPRPPSPPGEKLPLNKCLYTVEEERSSQISTPTSQQAFEFAAGGIADICTSTLDTNKSKNKKSDKSKAGSSQSSKKNSPSSEQTCPYHSKKPQKKPDHALEVELDDNTFSVKVRKRNSRDKSPTTTSGNSQRATPAVVRRATASSPQRATVAGAHRATAARRHRSTSASPQRATAASPQRPTSASPQRATAASPQRPTSASPQRATPIQSQPRASSASPQRTTPLQSQPRASSSDIQPYKPIYLAQPSRQVDSKISYAQVASKSNLPREEISVDQASVLLGFKEPEPPRPTTATRTNIHNLQRLDSSESNSGSPVIFQTETIVHRADSTESENSEDSPEEAQPEQIQINVESAQSTAGGHSSSQEKTEEAPKDNLEKPGSPDSTEKRSKKEGNKEGTHQKSKEDDLLSPIDSSGRDNSREETGADDEYSESIEDSKNKPALIFQPHRHTQGGSDANLEKASTSRLNQGNVHLVDSPRDYRYEFVEDYIRTRGTLMPGTETHLRNYPNTVADVNSDILDNEAREDNDRSPVDYNEDTSENALRGRRPPPSFGESVRSEPEQLTEIETLYSGEEYQPGASDRASISQTTQSSVSSSTHQTFPINEKFIEDYMKCGGYFVVDAHGCLEYEEQQKKLREKELKSKNLPERGGCPSDLESPTDSKSEEISGESEHPPISIDPSDSSKSDEHDIRIEVQHCSSDSREDSSSIRDDNKLGLLGANVRDISEESLEKAARLRKISCSTTEDQKSDTRELPIEVPGDDTSDDLSEGDSEEKEKEKIKKKLQKKLEERQGLVDERQEKEGGGPSSDLKESDPVEENTEGTAPSSDLRERDPVKVNTEGAVSSLDSRERVPVEINSNPPSESLVSEEIEEEKKYIQEDPEVDNQAVYQSDFHELLQGDNPEDIHIQVKYMKEAAIIYCKEMPEKIKSDSSDSPKRIMEKLHQRLQVRVLTLNNEEFHESVLYRLEKNWLIEFRLGPTLFGRKIDIYCNFPIKENGKLKEFVRKQYNCLNWKQDGGIGSSDDTALYAQVECSISGSFHYYFTDKRTNSICGSGYFLVDPEITYGGKEHLPLDCIQCQTVISKHLGSFSTWESKLRVSKESGYNMVHFTPVQELGESNSAYCLNDQLKLNPSFRKENGDEPTWEELKCMVDKMRTEWKVTSICDIVLNHTANESLWIKQHPEATYNCQNCEYMRPAYLLDAALGIFNKDVKEGMYETRGIPSVIDSEDHLNAMRYHLKETVMKELKLHELSICNVNAYVSKFMEMARQHQPEKDAKENEELILVQDPDYRRLASTVDMNLAIKMYNIYRPDCFDEDSRLRRSCEEFKRKLDSLNQVVIDKIQDHLNCAVENIISGVRYWRVQSDGPKLKEITIQNPLVTRYFTDYGNPKNILEYEEIMYSDKGRFLMAHNGWIMDSDPLVNFARPESNVYIRRELIAWGDSVKLRYGDKPSDSPFLWDMMKKYVELTASIFDGVRLDNCHSTPLEVAEYLMDCARKVRPDLYVVAELFTNSDQKDNIFVNRLGITSLIREAMSASDSHDLGRLVYRYGGIPVGTFYQPDVRPLVPTIAHALLFDLTHDNPSPVEARSVFNLLPSAALVNMACCGTGSNRGYDELVPHQISVVDETRDYSEWSQKNVDEIPKYISRDCGIIEAKKAINDLHFKLGCAGFNQVYVDQMDSDVVAVTRHCPKTHQSYILVAFTAFNHPNNEYPRCIRPLRVEGVLDEIVLEATLSHAELSNGGSKYAHPKNFKMSDHYINGYSEYVLNMKQNIQLSESEILEETSSGNPDEIALHFKNFKPGSIVIIKVSLKKSTSEAVSEVRKLADQFSYTQETDLKQIIKKLELRDLNRVLYRCDQEERDEGNGFDTYGIPGFEKLVYAGLQGFISLLSKIRPMNDLGHPMCGNIRQGDWMIDYIYQRLKLDKGTEELGKWIEENTKALKNIPKYLKPAYFDLIFTGIYVLLLEHSYNSMSSFVKNGSMFVKALSMGSIQFAAYIRSADLPPLSPNLTPPKPPTKKDQNGEETQICVSLSAGLPHFSVGYMRNWGRDTFIALRGLLLLTDRYQEARYHILAYGACLRHGLIPNLLDGGRNSRYNCRDAVWWWLYCIRCYAEEAPNGVKILEDKVSRIFPTDDSPAQQPGATDQTLQEVMQEALSRHFQGVTFRERNAGREIDEHMTDNGFNNQIGVHLETGFVFGGNVDNCGTWMDKMGSSEKAGNRGRPATPRDGSACEIVGLSKCVISWLAVMHDKGLYKYGGVERTHSNGKTTNWSFTFWAGKIQKNFEKCFWVNEKPTEGEMKPNLINKRGIYKDCYGATQEWTDYQLRCNFPIVMVVAPELFNPQHAWTALQKVEQHLLGPLGIKTLDPDDWAYRADYDNSNDSGDATVSHGFNYHQGPEWLWPVGFFLRAKLYFAAKNDKLKETIAETKYTLARHFTELQSSDWRGLPELTNSNGSYCRDSSRTQAWSMSCILEVLHDLQRIESSIS